MILLQEWRRRGRKVSFCAIDLTERFIHYLEASAASECAASASAATATKKKAKTNKARKEKKKAKTKKPVVLNKNGKTEGLMSVDYENEEVEEDSDDDEFCKSSNARDKFKLANMTQLRSIFAISRSPRAAVLQ